MSLQRNISETRDNMRNRHLRFIPSKYTISLPILLRPLSNQYKRIKLGMICLSALFQCQWEFRVCEKLGEYACVTFQINYFHFFAFGRGGSRSIDAISGLTVSVLQHRRVRDPFRVGLL